MYGPERKPDYAGLPLMVGFNIFSVAHEEAIVEIWPENLPAVQMFQCIGTRWVFGGMGGVTGIRWEAVYPLMDRMDLSREAWDSLLSDMEVMERAALGEINKK